MADERHERCECCERLERRLDRRLRALTRRVRTLELEVAGLEPRPATHATLTIGADMAGLSIDATDGTVTVDYEDDHNDPNAATPADAALVFTSSDPTVATVAPDPTLATPNPLQQKVTPVAVGPFTITVSGLGSKADGTPIPDVSASDTVIAGAASQAALVIAG